MGLPGRCSQVFRGRGGNEVPMENVAMATKMEVTNLQPLPISKASDQEILQYDKILARNSTAHCPQESSTKEIIMPTVILEGLYDKIINNNILKVVQASIAKSVPSLWPTASTRTSQNLVRPST